MLDPRDMNDDEIRSAYETAALIRNKLDESASLEDLRVYISEIIHEYTRLSLNSDQYFTDMNARAYTNYTTKQINEILVGEVKHLTALINTGEYYHG